MTLTHENPVALSGNMITLLDEICHEQKCPSMRMPSGAGHDAMHLAKITETGMIFIPCCGGISHHAAEQVSMQDVQRGVDVLLGAVCKLAAERDDPARVCS